MYRCFYKSFIITRLYLVCTKSIHCHSAWAGSKNK